MLFPKLLLLLMIASIIESLYNKKFNDALYWFSATLLNLSIIIR